MTVRHMPTPSDAQARLLLRQAEQLHEDADVLRLSAIAYHDSARRWMLAAGLTFNASAVLLFLAVIH